MVYEAKAKNEDYAYADIAPLGDLGERLIALAIDSFLLSLMFGLVFGASSDEIGFVVNLIVTALYNWWFWTNWDGQTPGKRVMKLRIVKTDGSSLNTTDALIRSTGYFLNTFIAGIGWLWALFSDNKQGWHDIMAGTIVIKDNKRR